MPPKRLADVGVFEEALAWFRARVPMTDTQYTELEQRAGDKAFWVTGAANLDTVNDVWQALERALEQGITLDDFKKAVSAKLAREWGAPNATRVETIFRTNVQLAYSAGRYRQQMAPAVARSRPYGEFIALLDARSSEICPPLNGIILPLDHPWWTSHYPPLHHNCRSLRRTLRASQAEERGVTDEPPPSEADEGFGGVPGDDEWEPNLADYPPELGRAMPKPDED